MNEPQWLMRIESGLSAHFKQSDGSSRAGTDWVVGLKNGDALYKVMVHAFLSDDLAPALRKDQTYQGQTVLGYISDLLNLGWTPDQPRDHVIYIQNPPGGQ
jgi:hypothetical protein